MMTGTDLILLLPSLLLAAFAVIAMLGIAVRRSHGWTAFCAACGFLLAIAAGWRSLPLLPRPVTGLLFFDRFALLMTTVILAAGLAVSLISHAYLSRGEGRNEEFSILLRIASLGAAVLAASVHFAAFFLGLELLTVSLYGLIASPRRGRSYEAGMKYLILAAVSSAFLLFGMALVYAETGSLAFPPNMHHLPAEVHSPLLLAGFGLMIAGVGFKLALVPFHLWTPDVYEGAPAPVTAFIATASKTAVFAVLLRLAPSLSLQPGSPLFAGLSLIAVLSMLAGNLLALRQENVKRMLAYSSIAHLGYVLVPFLAGGSAGASAAVFYLIAYTVTSLGAFGTVAVLSGKGQDRDSLEDYRGLAWRQPGTAAVLSVMFLSLAGMPVTGGFMAKVILVSAGVHASLWLLLAALVAGSVIGLFYYLRMITAIFSPPGAVIRLPVQLSLLGNGVLALLLFVLLWLGLLPGPLLRLVQASLPF